MIALLLFISFCIVQLYFLYKDHLSLRAYSWEDKQNPKYKWYQFQTYGTALLYIALIVYGVRELFNNSASLPKFNPVASFKSDKVTGGGRNVASAKRHLNTKLRNMRHHLRNITL